MQITAMDGATAVRALLNGGAISLPWKSLSSAEFADLACDVAGEDGEGHALAAYFLYAAGRRQEAEDRLAKAGADAERIRALFAPTGVAPARERP
ncbi:MAG: hypothetical protein H0X38_13225 [Planctomycetes bacterium]|nr:hypothetical protein [Planctomycetota bacterium]